MFSFLNIITDSVKKVLVLIIQNKFICLQLMRGHSKPLLFLQPADSQFKTKKEDMLT